MWLYGWLFLSTSLIGTAPFLYKETGEEELGTVTDHHVNRKVLYYTRYV